VLSLQLPEGYVIVFDPVLHMSQHIEVTGEPARESQSLSFVMTRDHAARPGPLRCTQAFCRLRGEPLKCAHAACYLDR